MGVGIVPQLILVWLARLIHEKIVRKWRLGRVRNTEAALHGVGGMARIDKRFARMSKKLIRFLIRPRGFDDDRRAQNDGLRPGRAGKNA